MLDERLSFFNIILHYISIPIISHRRLSQLNIHVQFSMASLHKAIPAYRKWTAAIPRPRIAPTAAVCLGAAPAAGEEDAAPAPPEADGAAATDLDGVGTPEVKGALETDEAPEKAPAPAAAVGLAMVRLLGFRTLGVLLVRCDERRSIDVDLRVNNVNDTTGDEDIRGNDTRGVDKNRAIVNGDGQILAVDSRDDGAVPQGAAVSDSAVYDMVCEDVGQVSGGEGTETRADGLEGSVPGREDGYVAEAVDSGDEAGVGERAGEGGQAGGDGGVGGALGEGEDAVDDVDHTAGEVDVLYSVR